MNCTTYLWANSSFSCAALRSIAASSSSHCVSLEDTIAARAKEAHDVHAEQHRGLHKRRDTGSIWLNFMVGVRFRDRHAFVARVVSGALNAHTSNYCTQKQEPQRPVAQELFCILLAKALHLAVMPFQLVTSLATCPEQQPPRAAPPPTVGFSRGLKNT